MKSSKSLKEKFEKFATSEKNMEKVKGGTFHHRHHHHSYNRHIIHRHHTL